MEMLVVGWLVLELTDSAWQVALVGFYRSIPLLVVGFIAGPVASRVGRLRLILLSQGTSQVTIFILTALLWTDRIALWHLQASAVIFGICWSFNWTSRRALMPDIVGKNQTVEAMLLESFTGNISRVLGPLLGGILIDILGAPGGYTAVAIISAISLFYMFLVRPPAQPAASPATASPWTLMVEGLRYMRRNQAILGALLITVVMNFFIFPYQTLLPVFARDVLGQGPVGLGWLGAANGIGAFAGLYLVNRLRNVFSRGWIFGIGSAFQSLMLLGFSFSNVFPASIALLAFSGLGHACFSVMQSSIVLISAEDHMRDRAMGALVLAIGTGPLGQLQIGALAEVYGAPFALHLQAAASFLLVLLVIALLPEFRKRLS